MFIIVYCPDCNKRYGVRPDLQGKQMRCPMPSCGKVFTVQEAKDPPPYDKPDDVRWPDLPEPADGPLET